MVDYVSGSWTTDQTLTFWPASPTMVQYSILAEALHDSTHSDDCSVDGVLEPHALGPLIGNGSDGVTFFRNVFANNVARNPPFLNEGGGVHGAVNNIVYNATRCNDADGAFRTSVDDVDARTLAGIRSGTDHVGTTGRRLDHPDEVGGYPAIEGGPAYTDADGDGMADAWDATARAVVKRSRRPDTDPDGDGYTNLEEYLNGTSPGSATRSSYPTKYGGVR